ncbi:conserved hypothetical protein, partial [Trichinella spiralis]
RSEHHKGL